MMGEKNKSWQDHLVVAAAGRRIAPVSHPMACRAPSGRPDGRCGVVPEIADGSPPRPCMAAKYSRFDRCRPPCCRATGYNDFRSLETVLDTPLGEWILK